MSFPVKDAIVAAAALASSSTEIRDPISVWWMEFKVDEAEFIANTFALAAGASQEESFLEQTLIWESAVEREEKSGAVAAPADEENRHVPPMVDKAGGAASITAKD